VESVTVHAHEVLPVAAQQPAEQQGSFGLTYAGRSGEEKYAARPGAPGPFAQAGDKTFRDLPQRGFLADNLFTKAAIDFGFGQLRRAGQELAHHALQSLEQGFFSDGGHGGFGGGAPGAGFIEQLEGLIRLITGGQILFGEVKSPFEHLFGNAQWPVKGLEPGRAGFEDSQRGLA